MGAKTQMSFPIEFKNIDSQDDIKTLQKYLDDNQSQWEELEEGNYWKGRTIFYHQIIDENIRNILEKVLSNSLSVIHQNIEDKKDIYCEHLSLARWPVGYDLKPHADAENPPDCPRHEYYWRDYACVTFLNDNFKGGNLFFPDLNIKVEPKPGFSVCFPGTLKFLHGVTEILEGTRYTIASFLTHDISKKSIDITYAK